MTLGERITKLRTERGISQVELAEKTGLSRMCIYKCENDDTTDPRLYTIKSIADALGVTLDELPLSDYKVHTSLFEEDLYHEIALETCVAKRISEGGTSVSSVEAQIAYVRKDLN